METSHRVSDCPQDEKEWQKASDRLHCSDTGSQNRYHCLPVDTLTTLLEFCYNRTRAQVTKGTMSSHTINFKKESIGQNLKLFTSDRDISMSEKNLEWNVKHTIKKAMLIYT